MRDILSLDENDPNESVRMVSRFLSHASEVGSLDEREWIEKIVVVEVNHKRYVIDSNFWTTQCNNCSVNHGIWTRSAVVKYLKMLGYSVTEVEVRITPVELKVD